MEEVKISQVKELNRQKNPFDDREIVTFRVNGEPQGKARPRFNTRTGHAYTPSNTRMYEQEVLSALTRVIGNERWGKDDSLAVTIIAGFSIPSSDSKKKRLAKLLGAIQPTKKPDADNIAKVIIDAIQGKGKPIPDDSQITSLSVRKRYSESPYTAVLICRDIYEEEELI